MSIAPPAAARRALHLRRITRDGYQRDDGLFEIDGLLIGQRNSPLGGCHALRLDGAIVRTHFPQHSTTKDPRP